MKKNLPKATSTHALSLAALGIVYGDIGTSPLYAFRAAIADLPVCPSAILGALSLIFWSLFFVVSIKYLALLLQADNHGEGGILALLALIKRNVPGHSSVLFFVAIFGSGLLLGDGMLTPAISVISAVEGIHVIFPDLSNWIIPITCVILLGLFFVQSSGTARIGKVFGPVILIWLITIAILGLKHIIHQPIVLKALNPYYAFHFFCTFGWKGYLLLGGIFLVLTGGEALYTDLGHFGKKPIRISWFYAVLPCLILNYFGQGAYLLTHPKAILNPFFMLAPEWFTLPLLVLATLATIIASQAVICATFSLVKQAVSLGYYPQLPIIHTSDQHKGQIYVPQMNLLLGFGTLLLVFIFRNSETMSHAYGIAVNLVMIMTTLLVFYYTLYKQRMNSVFAVILYSLFLIIDFSFLGANLFKVHTGGWIPVAFALICAFIMFTWHQGRVYIHKNYFMKKPEIDDLLDELLGSNIHLIPNMSALFITNVYDKHGGYFLKFLKLNRFFPEFILLINHHVENIPYVPIDQRVQCKLLKKNICKVTMRYGFLDEVDIPLTLSQAQKNNLLPFPVDFSTNSYFIEISNVIASREKKSLLFYWQEKIFEFLAKNYSANLNIEYYHLPFERTIAIGTYYKI